MNSILKRELEINCNKSDGIFSFINESSLTGNNLKFNKLYNKIAWSYNLSQRIFFWFKFGGERKFRSDFLNELQIKSTDKVLEISTGTADNFRFLNKEAEYFGVDISFGMLKQAKRHIQKWNMKATLIHCEGENLPFVDNSFDVVFHCGGINYFNNKAKAIEEMIRVAKPGTVLLIVDETEKLIRENYRKNPLLKSLFTEASMVESPVDLIPSTMQNVKAEIICKGLMYKITFNKPNHLH